MSSATAVIRDAGRDLDRLIAERVFGLVRCQAGYAHGPEGYPNDNCYALPESPDRGGELRSYSTDIAAAWEVVEKLLETHAVDVNAIPGESVIQWGVTMQRMPFIARYPEHGACAKTAPLAICLAALEAVAPRHSGNAVT